MGNVQMYIASRILSIWKYIKVSSHRLSVAKNVLWYLATILIFAECWKSKAFSWNFSPINVHGKCDFSPLNHIAGRVKIVLGGKRKRLSTSCGHLGRSHNIRVANPEVWAWCTCTGTWNRQDGRIFRGRYSQREKGFLVQDCRNVTSSRLSEKNIWSLTLLSLERVVLQFTIAIGGAIKFFSIKI